ncbi:MAG: hypothetical protein RL367_1412 [Pseudomonadota bacterium]
MTLFAFIAMAASAAPQPDPRSQAAVVTQMQISQLQIQQTTIVRIRPANVPLPNRPIPQIQWQEKKGPSCIQVNAIGGALVSSPDTIDMVLRGGSRLRAKLEKNCMAIDFFQGFYVKPSKDGRICQERDTIRSRLGAECGINRFKTLVPSKDR